jgi:chitinase
LPYIYKMKGVFCILLSWLVIFNCVSNDFAVIAYYSGNSKLADSFQVEKLTHIIFSFGHLKGNRLNIDSKEDSLTITRLVSLKKRNPSLKVILSLGGWTGCKTCSEVFSKIKARNEFANSVFQLLKYFGADGIDLDWEYPAIAGPPGHPFALTDRENFTKLIKTLRKRLGWKYEISFAAGGFRTYLEKSIDWNAVMPLVDKVNLMSYDLVHGYSTVTGHHTPLYSTSQQQESADFAIRYLDSIGVPLKKVIIGAAFYGRTWENVPDINNGLYQPGKFQSFIDYKRLPEVFSGEHDFVFYRDTIAEAPYAYSRKKKTYLTFDDPRSVAAKTRYAKEKKLGGIMFWELSIDQFSGGLLDVIDSVARRPG